ncbi:efflux RND transporter periplasmic adaptor subunit [Pontiella agarivorans]|uniref:Efflux RND transporter periplasmic adaptor subunit n=1 Tax=Pontiella agarivorans TaxID=3038953 RepID=A0ABU5MZ83_9BACT|nr:efflux RND transporter periplasmic adaptor subunit [Pontiella agarivorans]MDZ8119488.1 efflux RND transporter periplasmic adaptor subunit [Pontiella agarivorans]
MSMTEKEEQVAATSRRKPVVISLAVFGVLAVGGIFFAARQAQADTEAPVTVPPAREVEVELVSETLTRTWREFSGRMAAVDRAEIRPQVSGAITEIRFADGQRVEKGDVLFVIDPRPYAAAVQQAEAELSSARAQSELAQTLLERAEVLIKESAIAQRLYDERASNMQLTKAAVLAAEARLEQARLNLDYAYIKAPFSGRLSRAEITLGNLVSAGPTAPLLTTLVSDEGIYAEFEVDEKTYMDHIHIAAGIRNREIKIPVEITIGAGQNRYEGFVHSLDNQIDASTGTIRGRAFFPNENTELVPGMFVRVNLGSPEKQEHILLNEKAIGTNQSRKYVYVVNQDHVVEYREVILGENIAGRRVIESGLEEGEMVITAGLMRIRPGMPVEPIVKTAAQPAGPGQQLSASN